MRNFVLYTLARQTGEYAARTAYAEIFVNDQGASQSLTSQYRVISEKTKNSQKQK